MFIIFLQQIIGHRLLLVLNFNLKLSLKLFSYLPIIIFHLEFVLKILST